MKTFLLFAVSLWTMSFARADTIIFQPDAKALSRATLSNTKTELITGAGGRAVKVLYNHKAPYPHIRFEAEKAGFSADWSAYLYLGFTVENPSREPVRVNVRVDCAANVQQGRQGGAELLPGEKKRFVLPLGGKPIIGMRGQPPAMSTRPGDVMIAPSPTTLDLSQINRFQLFMSKLEKDRAILLHRIELFGDARKGAGAFVDKFGQFNGTDWPGKLHNESEFTDRIKTETAELAKHPAIPGRNRWGGWADGPTLKATGRFYAAKHKGKWWLVDPDGKLFWSNGITCVRFNQITRVKDRELYFEWLPGPGDPLRQFYTTPGKRSAAINFYEMNLFRKYGPDYKARFYDNTVRRFQSWGINTIANWSDFAELAARRAVPYTITVPVGTKRFLASEHMKAGLAKKKFFPDVFDPSYATNLEAGLRQSALAHKDDPWLLGVFVDNELHWVSGNPMKSPVEAERVSAIAFKNDGSFAIKKALVKMLEAKFGTPDKLNQLLGTSFRQWDELLAPVTFTKEQRKTGVALFAELDTMIAEQYFRTISATIKRLLPGVPYLGCRFSNYSEEVVRVAAKYCDVVCFNIYEYLPEMRLADELSAKYDFPVVIGEFHFGALDRGMFDPGLRKAENQADRAAKYAAYVEQAARGAWCVGAHWFQYVDQALTGRDDGENYNIGFVTVVDTPYPELVAAARKLNRDLYRLRMEK